MITVYVNLAVVCPFAEEKIKAVVKRAEKIEPKIKGEVEINVVNDVFIKNINKQYRGRNKVTDVLSFAWSETRAVSGTKNLGQIFICLPRIKRQAKEYGVEVREEFARMLAHGLLHLVGYDHEKGEKEEKIMSTKQEKIVREAKGIL